MIFKHKVEEFNLKYNSFGFCSKSNSWKRSFSAVLSAIYLKKTPHPHYNEERNCQLRATHKRIGKWQNASFAGDRYKKLS